MAKPNLAVVYCAVLEDEIEAFAAGLPHVVHVEKLPQGLHNEPDRLRRELQEIVTRIEENPEVDAIILGYGLCSRGTEEVVAKRCRLVLARAHDCITLFLGSKERYADYVSKHPGTYWYSPGWNKHHLPPGKGRYEHLKAQYVEKYGEENAEFLMEEEQHWFSTYDRATWVDLGEGEVEAGIEETKGCAKWLGWNFDCQKGDAGLLKALIDADWDDERFLVLEPGQSLKMTADARVIEARDAS